MNTVKKLWRYVRHYKVLLTISLISLILIQVLGLIAPLLIKSIFDDHLAKIEQPWYENNEEGVFFNDRYYSQTIVSDRLVYIHIINGNYVFLDEVIENGIKTIENNQLIVQTETTTFRYDAILLNSQAIRNFYAPSFEPIMVLVVLLVVRFFMQIALTYLQRITTSMINVNIVRDARKDAVKALQKIPMRYFDQEPAGKIANRILSDTGGMMQLFSTLMNLVVNASFAVIFAYIGMFYLDKTLAFYTFLSFPLIYIWFNFFIKKLKVIAEKVNEKASLMTAQLNEIINGIQILQIFNFKKQTETQFSDLSNSFMQDKMSENILHLSIGWNLIRLLGALVTAIIIFYFGYQNVMVSHMLITAGLVYAYNDYLTRLVEPVSILFREIGNLEHALVKTERIFTVIDGELESSIYEEIAPFNGKITFDNVWFSYKEGHPVLKGIDLNVVPGEMIGLVGHTGSGKSSMMNLLLRFYDLKPTDKGVILVDDKDIQTFSKRAYREHIGIILQDPVMFKGTLRENILFGKQATDETIVNTLNSVGGDFLLQKLGQGLDTQISRKGGNLSVGEKQIIAFTRALIHNTSILIMDEATANIDTETEMMLQKALESIRGKKTMIVIAHRLSTIKRANRIVVLQEGLKVEEGSHDELIQYNGVYANMYRAQVK